MSKLVIVSPRIFAVQNALAALLFAGLLGTFCLEYLLYLYPGSELLWSLSLPANRLAGSLLHAIDGWLGMGPFALAVVLGSTVFLPIIAQKRKSWLGTSIAGHVALAVAVVLTYDAMNRAQVGRSTASLSPIFDPAIFDPNSTSLTMATMVLIALCVLNHVVFLRRELR